MKQFVSDNPTLPQLTEQQTKLLESLFSEETVLYGHLMEKMAQKRQIIISGDIAGLAKADQELMGLYHQAKELEKKRKNALEKCHCPATLPLADLIRQIPPTDTSRFNRLHQQLTRLAQDIQQEQNRHKDLIHLSLKWIEGTVQLIARTLNPEAASYTGNPSLPGDKRIGASSNQSTVERSA